MFSSLYNVTWENCTLLWDVFVSLRWKKRGGMTHDLFIENVFGLIPSKNCLVEQVRMRTVML